MNLSENKASKTDLKHTIRKRYDSFLGEKSTSDKYSSTRGSAKENSTSTRLIHPMRKPFFPLEALPHTSELLKRR